MPKNSLPLFIDKTWEMLHSGRHLPTVRWSPSGDSFQITNEAQFVEQVLPLYFKHANLSSFIRQVPPPSVSWTCITSTRRKPAKDTLNLDTNSSEEIKSNPPLTQTTPPRNQKKTQRSRYQAWRLTHQAVRPRLSPRNSKQPSRKWNWTRPQRGRSTSAGAEVWRRGDCCWGGGTWGASQAHFWGDVLEFEWRVVSGCDC